MATAKPTNPRGLHTLTPNLTLRDCAKAIEFYKRAFGAQEVSRMNAPDGKSVWHAELKIGDSFVFVNDEMPGMGRPAPSADNPVPVTMWLYVPDCDTAYDRAVKEGAKSLAAPEDMFWGDRCAGVTDPYGYMWSFATHQKDLTEEEMRRAGEEFARTMQQRQAQQGQGPQQPGAGH
ncbi:MAG TPA: VOC family protein [Anaeromyxobacter sp.]